MGKTQKIGNIGENIAAIFLESKGHRIVKRNYSKKWGEIDIITVKSGITHFVEVKTISRLSAISTEQTDENKRSVSRESLSEYRPEENMHRKKIERLNRAIQSYIGEYNVLGEWQLDLVAVRVFIKDKKADCRLIENVL